MTDTCVKHSFETAAGVCKQCRNSYCAECLVYPFGEKKPPYCVTCALNVSGVRSHGAKPNPRLRKKGIFGRKVLVEEEPRKQLGFNDIHIELPTEAATAPVATQVTRREVSPEVLAMVEEAEARDHNALDAEVGGGVAVAAPPYGSDNSLADWAASLETDSASPTTQPSDSASRDAWPDEL